MNATLTSIWLNNEVLCDEIDVDDYDTIQSLCQRNSRLQKSVIHARIVDIVVAMSSLLLPPYIILEIVDKFEYW
eukprot:CAMPEP_0168590588 /NCGR_PEP_ID=MMETSP0420-20121227/6652_1 /TAXON_ID=498008 /ORGANISM="Pessonella sp." /LENGTH=73 /DNA_ID=CAMNT_0008626265 /DNA_START=95 /DNA_END=313 /DNA_ORIENTATION=-